MTALPELQRTTVAIDLESGDIAEALLRSGKFDPAAPSFFIYECVSMYLNEMANSKSRTAWPIETPSW